MTDSARVLQQHPDTTSESELSSKQPVKKGVKQGIGSWSIRYHADGSWSVATESQAANDPDYSVAD